MWDGQVRTALFEMDHQQGPTIQHKELCSMSGGSLDGRRAWGRMDACICLAESLRCSPETITTLLISYTPIQNVLVLKNNKNENLKKIILSSI